MSIILQSKPPSLGTGMVGLLGDSLEGGRDGNGKDQACGKEPEAEASVYKRLELGLKGQGFMKNDAQTDRTEMRNCLFALVGGEKNVTALLFQFLGQTVLAKLFSSR